MFRITTKVKLAGAIAAGALSLGVVGASAAAGGTTTLTSPPGTASFKGPNGSSLTLDNLKATGTSTATLTFTNEGQCVSNFAKSKDFALPSSVTTSLKLSKNFHGKLMSSTALKQFCAAFKSASTTAAEPAESPEVEQPDATQSESPDTDTSTGGQGKGHGHHGHGLDLD